MYEPRELLPFDCTESTRPMMEASRRLAEISIAGESLAKLRQEAKHRPPRVYTGRVGRKRGWRGMPVILPRGQIGNLIMALRGIAVIAWNDPLNITPNRIGYFRVRDLLRFKTPAAVLLGSLKKGVTETPSLRKANAARCNGCAPPRPGNRPRGRPRATPPPGTVSSSPA